MNKKRTIKVSEWAKSYYGPKYIIKATERKLKRQEVYHKHLEAKYTDAFRKLRNSDPKIEGDQCERELYNLNSLATFHFVSRVKCIERRGRLDFFGLPARGDVAVIEYLKENPKAAITREATHTIARRVPRMRRVRRARRSHSMAASSSSGGGGGSDDGGGDPEPTAQAPKIIPFSPHQQGLQGGLRYAI